MKIDDVKTRATFPLLADALAFDRHGIAKLVSAVAVLQECRMCLV
jgi:hypothetical protein